MQEQHENMTEEQRQEAILKMGQDKLAFYQDKQHKAENQLLQLDHVQWGTIPIGEVERDLSMHQADIALYFWGSLCYQAIRGLVQHIEEHEMGDAVCVLDEQGNIKITVE